MTRERTVMSQKYEHQRMPGILAGLVGEAIRLEARNDSARELLEEWLKGANLHLASPALKAGTEVWLRVLSYPHDGSTSPCLCDGCNPF